MIVVGIDTSLRSTGYAVIEKQGSSLRALDYGTIKNKPRDPLTQCVKNIFENILRDRKSVV